MDLWSQVIVEWVNCLDVSDTQIKSVWQLQSEKCYEKLIYLLSGKAEEVSRNEDVVTDFIKNEYPEFIMEEKEQKADSNIIYIGSLLLMCVSQELSFQKPMCSKLHQDTQIKIKTFLELVLPYGKNITREILCQALIELGDPTPKTPLTIQRKQLLKEFFNSPASRSAHSHRKITERNRELRQLRIELETERFEKIDLQEDLEIQRKKIETLEKKLQEKTAEIKLLQEERLQPATPQSCKKHKNMNQYEILCRKEVDRLEHELLQQQVEMNKVEEEKDVVLKKLGALEQECVALKEKCTSFESSAESLLVQIELRDRELIDLKMTNEELRTHLAELKRKSVGDQSYEGDSLLMPASPKTGEVLSSVVDLQLQEVKKESDELKAHFESVNSKLKCVIEENNRLGEVNNVLHSDVQRLLPYVEENERLKEIAIQKGILEQEIVKLQNTVIKNSTFLSSLSISLENFDTEVHSRMENVISKLGKSTQRIEGLEESKLKLQKYYESKLNLLTTDTYDLKLEKENLSRDLHHMHESYELLQEKSKDMSVHLTCKDKQIEELYSTVNSLEDQISRYTVDQQQTRKELDGLKVLLESTNEEKNRLIETNNVLQQDCRNMTTQYKESNARLMEVSTKNYILEQDISKLQHTIVAKDKFVSLLSSSLESFGINIYTKMDHITRKLDVSKQRIVELENSKNKLQQYYESRISVLNTDMQNTKLEESKLLLNLETVNNSYESLRLEAKEMSIQMKYKDEQIEALHSEIKTLEDEMLKCIADLHNARTDSEALKEEIKSLSDKLTCTNEDNDHLRDKITVLQNDIQKMMEYEKENVLLREIKEQKCSLEKDIVKLQNIITEKDKFLATLPLSLKNFEVHLQTKMEQVSSKLDKSSERIKDLEEAKKKLAEYYAAKIDLLSSERQNMNLEQAKLLVSLEKMTSSSDELQEQVKDMTAQIQCKDEEIQTLCSEVRNLKDEMLTSTTVLQDAKNESIVLKTQLKSTNEELKSKDEKSLVLYSELVDINTNLRDASVELAQAAQRVKDHEDAYTKLQMHYESKISQVNSDMESLKLERNKLLGDIQEMSNDYKLLGQEIKNMSAEIESKSEEIRVLCSEINCLKIECEHLTSSAEDHQLLKCSKETLESQLLDKQRLLDQANEDIQLKEKALQALQSEMEQIRLENSALKEMNLAESKLENNTLVQEKLVKTSKASNDSIDVSVICGNNSKSGEIKQISENELRLQSQIDGLLKEKRELKEKLDKNRTRSAKLEIHVAELRNERLKAAQESTFLSTDVENLKGEVTRLNEEKVLLSQKIEDLSKRPNEEDFADRLKGVHETYKEKLDEIKKKMKLAYNEQVAKMNKTHALAMQKHVDDLRLQMEQLSLKHNEEISKYKAHVGELNKQFWHAAEKLLTEQQQKQEALQQLNELKVKFQGLQFDFSQTQSAVSKQQKCFKLEKSDFLSEDAFLENIRTVKITQEEIHERRHSMRSIQTIGNAFKTADEEGEVFDNTYLTDMKEGYCLPAHDVDRLSVLQQRNSLYLPHLKSSYPAEMQFYPANFNEEDIKTGSTTDEIFNDSLSQSLLPEQKTKKKDRSQISYKKPGPPTPSKNGRRLSLQGSGCRSPAFRTLRGRNSDRRTTTTPRVFKQMFTNLKRQDESVSSTPKRKISNIFRKGRVAERQQKL